jgi:cell division protease FtsH
MFILTYVSEFWYDVILLWEFFCRTLTPGHDPVQKVTLVPRGQARGLTWFIPMDDPTLISRQQLFARIVGGLGGRAAEEVIFGEPEVTTGAAGDLQQITGLAKQVYSTYIVGLLIYTRTCNSSS